MMLPKESNRILDATLLERTNDATQTIEVLLLVETDKAILLEEINESTLLEKKTKQ